MADTDQTPQTGGPGTNDGGQTGSAPAAGSGDQGKTFTQADIDRIVRERLAEARSREEKALAKAKADAEAAQLAEQGKWQEAATKSEARVKELEGLVAARERDLLAGRVAAKHGLPAELASRLRGDDETTLEADAQALKALLPPPGSGAGTTNPPANRAPALTADDIRKMSPDEINRRWDEIQRVLKSD